MEQRNPSPEAAGLACVDVARGELLDLGSLAGIAGEPLLEHIAHGPLLGVMPIARAVCDLFAR